MIKTQCQCQQNATHMNIIYYLVFTIYTAISSY